MGGLIRHTNQGGQQAGKRFHPPNINQLLAQVCFFVANLEEKRFFSILMEGPGRQSAERLISLYTFWEIISRASVKNK